MILGNFKYRYDVPISTIRCDNMEDQHQGFCLVVNKKSKVVDVFSTIRSVQYNETKYEGSFIAKELNFGSDFTVWDRFDAFRDWLKFNYKLDLIPAENEYGRVWTQYTSFIPIDTPDHMVYSFKIANATP